MTITSGIQSTGVVTMVMEVFYYIAIVTCAIHDLPDTYALGLQAYTHQANPILILYSIFLSWI